MVDNYNESNIRLECRIQHEYGGDFIPDKNYSAAELKIWNDEVSQIMSKNSYNYHEFIIRQDCRNQHKDTGDFTPDKDYSVSELLIWNDEVRQIMIDEERSV